MIRRRVPTITQITQTECGLCVAVALLGYHGRDEELADAREFLDAGRDGVGLKQIASFLGARGMDVRLVRAKSIDALSKFRFPVILHWDRSHFVVLESFNGKQAVIMDPAMGRRRVSAADVASHASGGVLWAAPNEDFQKRARPPFAEWRRAELASRETRWGIAVIGALSLVSYVALLGVPVLTQWLIDRRGAAVGSSGWGTAALIVALAAVFFVLQYLRVRTVASVMQRLGSSLMADVFGRLLRLPYKFFATRQPGELLFRLNSVNMVRDLITTRVAQGVLDLGTLLVVAVYITVVDWQLAAIATALLGANLTAAFASRRRIMELVDEEISHISNSNTMQLDAVVSIPAIRLGRYEDSFVERWRETFDQSLDAMERRMALQDGKLGGFLETMSTFGPILLLLVSLARVSSGDLTLGEAVSIQMIGSIYLSMANSISAAFTQFSEASRYMSRINEIIQADAEAPGGNRVALPTATVRLRDVDFRFNAGSPLTLHGIDLDVEDGERVAIVGPSGSGKSTLARIICTLYEPVSGRIFYGDRPRPEFALHELRSHIGFVPQENHMHNRPLLENLTLGRDIDRGDVIALCEELGLGDLLAELPMGLDTPVTEMGANFSGGQRQRIAIVRTLLQEPRILVLDEATASLDSVNERRIVEHLRSRGTTQIVIAHRLATIRDADQIVVLDAGRVVERGTHDALMAVGGHYARLYGQDLARSERDPIGLVNGVSA